MSPRRRRVAACASCGDPIRDDEEARLVSDGRLVHRRCGGRPASLKDFLD